MDVIPTAALHDSIGGFQAGDGSAFDSLIRRTQDRLEEFARRKLGGPGVRARERVEDVLRDAQIRLTRALGQEVPPPVGDFFGLADLHIRRELLDLAHGEARHPTAQLGGEGLG